MRTRMTALLAACLGWGAPADATQYSCLSIITEAKAIGKWDALRGWIDAAGLADEWGKCSYVSDDYPQYAAITNALVAGGVLTQEEADGILRKSVDEAVPDAALRALYAREMATEAGRTRWHGRLVRTDEDLTNLVQTLVYEDGYRFSRPFSSRKLSVEARFALERQRREAAERRRLAGLPPGLRAVERRRREAAATTNEVTVIYGPEGEAAQ